MSDFRVVNDDSNNITVKPLKTEPLQTIPNVRFRGVFG